MLNVRSLIDPEELVEIALEAEKYGWNGLFLGDHRSSADPRMTLSGVATGTDRLRLGSYITPIAR